ncbi:MAG: hypothetical protein IJQ12_02525 [Lachnospiraceae bacterium]|nr:hypothetical protein [Lachnospiraceae bacterium]
MAINFLQQLAEQTGFRLDEHTGMLHGTMGAYPMIVMYSANDRRTAIHVSVSMNGQAPASGTLKQAAKSIPGVTGARARGFHAIFLVKTAMGRDKQIALHLDAMRGVAEYLQMNGYVACCEHCGQPVETMSYNIKGNTAFLCQPCFAGVSNEMARAQYLEANKKENVVGGIVGALFGALVGGIAIVLIAKLGYVAWISGAIMGFCGLYGYKLLGGKLTLKGVIISVVMMVLVVYLANRVYYAIELQQAVARELGKSAASRFGFFEAFRTIPELLKEDRDVNSAYMRNLIMCYLFTALGAVPTVMQVIKNKKMEQVAERVGTQY